MAIGAGLELRVFWQNLDIPKVKTMQKLMEVCMEENISNLSLFAFSTENWKRPKDEIDFIFELLDRCLDEALEKFEKIMCV